MTKTHKTTVTICLFCLFCFNMLVTSSLSPQSVFKQFISWLIGVGLFVLGQNVNLKQLKSYFWPIIIFLSLFLTSPIIFGQNIRGSKRWIGIGFFRLQPTEIAKPGLAALLATTQNHYTLILPILITLAQPDLGTAIALILMLIPLFFYNKKIRKHLLTSILLLIAVSPIIWQFGLKDYQKSRITSFMAPQLDPLGKGYNLIQSKIAIGSAGLFGKGYKQGTQGQLLFLPEKHTDFIFAALTEEFGLIGSCILLGLYFILIKTLIAKAYQNQNSPPHFLYTLIIATQIWAQSFINIGMNIGILPITGTPLPFMSVGGSSIITLLMSIGIVFSN